MLVIRRNVVITENWDYNLHSKRSYKKKNLIKIRPNTLIVSHTSSLSIQLITLRV